MLLLTSLLMSTNTTASQSSNRTTTLSFYHSSNLKMEGVWDNNLVCPIFNIGVNSKPKNVKHEFTVCSKNKWWEIYLKLEENIKIMEDLNTNSSMKILLNMFTGEFPLSHRFGNSKMHIALLSVLMDTLMNLKRCVQDYLGTASSKRVRIIQCNDYPERRLLSD